ncbi:MAG TPA: WecB/TagA/CpsF family glycosyltransferase [Polyangiales bacterium]|nr:WecB/TagA/CpsF family glycosyltransferase [Polyangiales bacterium]
MRSVELLGMPLACVDEDGLLDHMFEALREGRGGWLITANLDFLRRYTKEPTMRALYAQADVMVADGMPLVWATQLLGEPLPERVAGSALIYRFAERAAAEGRTLYFLGGEPGAGEAAARVLTERHPGLRVVGWSAPRVSAEPTELEVAAAVAELRKKKPDLLLVGLGSPKQERLIHALRAYFPHMWMVGVGISFSFVAGHVTRAPVWMRKSGLEWIHRLVQEPKRLARRYLIEDLPFAAELFGRVLWARVSGAARGHGRSSVV